MLAELETLWSTGLLESLDVEIARSLCRIGNESDVDVVRAIALLSRSVRVGHSCLPLGRFADLTDEAESAQGVLFSPRAKAARTALRRSTLASDGSDFAPLVLDNADRLYFRRHWEYERRIARRLRERLDGDNNDDAGAAVAEAERLLPGPRSVDQRRAVALIATRRLAVVCGGPGTGKTTTVAAGLAALIRAGGADMPPKILLAAPTGKAASRIAESIAKAKQTLPVDAAVLAAIPDEAVTLHRALQLRPFDATRRHSLDHDIVVVDEASMVDLELMSQLLDALPAHARLVLVGDANQLASVEAGCVLRDLVEANEKATGTRDFVVELQANFRYREDSNLGRLAAAIRDGDVRTVQSRMETTSAEDAVARAVNRWRSALAAGGADLAHRDALTIMCPFRTGRLGTHALNAMIDGALGYDRRGSRPILIERNDHDLGIWNGDFGLLEARDAGAQAIVGRSSGEPIRVAAERLPPYSLAYAMTVHKAQGSEFDEVTLLMPDRDSPLLTRELLYTAVTRARHRADLVGRHDIVQAALARRATRFSGLVDAFVER